jgi:Zn-dependent protease with chaperone function
MIKKSLLILTLMVLGGCVYTTSTKSGAVGVERKQLMTISSSQMKEGANKAYKQIISKAKKDGTLNNDTVILKRIRTIAKRLIPEVKVYRQDALKWDWQVNLISSNQLNAWCMPGGKIAFYTGIINKLQLNDGEIAAIMGHEIAHALREHGRERASQQSIQDAGLSLISSYYGLGKLGNSLSQKVLDVTLSLPNSRSHETEADRMGVELAARAGYNPYDAVNVWKKMSQNTGQSIPEILSTHPSNKSRIEDLKKYAKKVEHLYIKGQKI